MTYCYGRRLWFSWFIKKMCKFFINHVTNKYFWFSSSVNSLSNVRIILESVFGRRTNKYVSQSALWISCLFIKLPNKNEKLCLTLDCSGIILNGSAKFRIEADNPNSQACYFNVINDEKIFNVNISNSDK